MEKKKMLKGGKGKREVYLFLHRVMAVVMVVCFVSVFCNSFITIDTDKESYSYVITPFDQKEVFEESEVFYDILNGNISDLTRMTVIRSQIETNGVYDGNKKIDITAYANRMDVVADNHVTAVYTLDDLIKWGNYGFDFQTVYGTWDELNDYFAKQSIYGEVGVAIDESGVVSEEEKSDEMTEKEATDLGLVPRDDDEYAMEILVPRYTTVDGKDLIVYASSITEYELLKKNLVNTASSLFTNYIEYTEYADEYNAENSNLRYCYQMMVNDEIVHYTNVPEIQEGMGVDDITSIISKYDKFLYFNPDKLQINTNLDITAASMRMRLNEYEYAFPDNTRVWIGLDTEFTAFDDFKDGQDVFSKFMPYYWQTVSIGFIAMLLWAYFFVLTIKNEYKFVLPFISSVDNDGNEHKKCAFKIDRFPLESMVMAMFIILAITIVGGVELYEYCMQYGFQLGWLPIVAGIVAFLVDVLLTMYFLSIVRRVKMGKVWKYTLLYTLWTKCKLFAMRTYDNGDLVSRFWIPYLIFLMVNLIMVLLGIGGVIGAVILDILIGIYLYKENKVKQGIIAGIENIKNGDLTHQISTRDLHGDNLTLAHAVNSIGEGIRKAVQTSINDERMKTDLITNVSHDIKTPLTSIISYVDLIKREEINNQNIKKYVDVLEIKAQRLKQLTDDLVEASKISSGNISLTIEKINLVELINQSMGEFYEKFEEKKLNLMVDVPDVPVYVEADSRGTWRVIENLFNNVYKYAMEGTRVYVDIEEIHEEDMRKIRFSVKNISAQPLHVNSDELTERFIRGDESRGTEGSGLGLSIAKSLIEAQKGKFEILLDGDLFKVMVTFQQKQNY